MCGRYILAQLAAAEQYFQLDRAAWDTTANYNVAPTLPVPIVRLGKDGKREGVMVRWGLIPYFAQGVPGKFSTINARIESFETAASYKWPWKRRQRCLQVASGFYEWHIDTRGHKVPFFIRLADQEVFAFASLWDRSRKSDGSSIESCVLITMPGNELMRDVHNAGTHPYRMPAILRREDYAAWLGGSADEARAVLKPYPSDLMVAYEVSRRVNDVKNNDAKLIEALDYASS